jgi:hypothetical protein
MAITADSKPADRGSIPRTFANIKDEQRDY